MVIFTRTPRLRRRKHVLIVSLAVADLFVGLISVPMYAYYVEGSYFSFLFLKVYYTQDVLFGLASLFGLAALAIERAYATYFPLKHRTLSKVPYIVGIAVVWASASIFAFSLEFIDWNSKIANIPTITTAISIPLLIVIIGYVLIWVKVTCMRTMPHQAIHHSNKKLTVTLAIVTVVSLITWIPLMAISVISQFCVHRSSCPDYSIIFSELFVYGLKFLQYGNSFVNFIIYTMRMREFKTEISRRFRCNSCHNPPNPQNEGIELRNDKNNGHVAED